MKEIFVFTRSSSAVIRRLVLPGLHERVGKRRWNWGAGWGAGGCCKGKKVLSADAVMRLLSVHLMRMLWPHRQKVLTDSPLNFGASLEETKESEFSSSRMIQIRALSEEELTELFHMQGAGSFNQAHLWDFKGQKTRLHSCYSTSSDKVR